MKLFPNFLLLSCACFMALPVCVVSTSWGQEDVPTEYRWNPAKVYKTEINNKKVQQQLRKIRDAKTATVMFIQQNMIDPPHNEMEFQEEACKYTVKDSAKIFNLEDLLVKAKTKARLDMDGGGGFSIGIYLTLQDNSVLKIKFYEPVSMSGDVVGAMENSSERQLIVSDANVIKKIYQWGLATKIQTHCNDFFKE
jgi:hypothetical protein